MAQKRESEKSENEPKNGPKWRKTGIQKIGKWKINGVQHAPHWMKMDFISLAVPTHFEKLKNGIFIKKKSSNKIALEFLRSYIFKKKFK